MTVILYESDNQNEISDYYLISQLKVPGDDFEGFNYFFGTFQAFNFNFTNLAQTKCSLFSRWHVLAGRRIDQDKFNFQL